MEGDPISTINKILMFIIISFYNMMLLTKRGRSRVKFLQYDRQLFCIQRVLVDNVWNAYYGL